jgi:hypothetical protein
MFITSVLRAYVKHIPSLDGAIGARADSVEAQLVSRNERARFLFFSLSPFVILKFCDNAGNYARCIVSVAYYREALTFT